MRAGAVVLYIGNTSGDWRFPFYVRLSPYILVKSPPIPIVSHTF